MNGNTETLEVLPWNDLCFPVQSAHHSHGRDLSINNATVLISMRVFNSLQFLNIIILVFPQPTNFLGCWLIMILLALALNVPDSLAIIRFESLIDCNRYRQKKAAWKAIHPIDEKHYSGVFFHTHLRFLLFLCWQLWACQQALWSATLFLQDASPPKGKKSPFKVFSLEASRWEAEASPFAPLLIGWWR